MPNGTPISEGKTASRGDTCPDGLKDGAAELEPDLLSLFTNEDALDFGMEGRAGKAECGGIGSGGTGGMSWNEIGAPIGMRLICSCSDFVTWTIDVCGLDEDEDEAVALEDA